MRERQYKECNSRIAGEQPKGELTPPPSGSRLSRARRAAHFAISQIGFKMMYAPGSPRAKKVIQTMRQS